MQYKVGYWAIEEVKISTIEYVDAKSAYCKKYERKLKGTQRKHEDKCGDDQDNDNKKQHGEKISMKSEGYKIRTSTQF